MLPETAFAALVNADVVKDRHLRQAELRQPKAVLGSQTGLAAERLDHQRKARAADLLRGLLIKDIQRRLVDEAHVNAAGPQTLGGVIGAVKSISERDDVSVLALEKHVVLATDKFVAVRVVRLPGLIQELRHRRSKREDEPETRLPEDLLHHLVGLQLLRGEVQRARLLALEPVIAEEGVDPEVARVIGHAVHPRVGEMAEHVRIVQSRVSDLADHHLAEGAERRKEALLALLAAKPSACREVPTLHDSALHVHLRVLLPDLVGSGRAH